MRRFLLLSAIVIISVSGWLSPKQVRSRRLCDYNSSLAFDPLEADRITDERKVVQAHLGLIHSFGIISTSGVDVSGGARFFS